MLSTMVFIYISQPFICPQPHDWLAQFYMRQIQNNLLVYAPKSLQSIVPFIGPLHVQLNARERACILNIDFFKRYILSSLVQENLFETNLKHGGFLWLRSCSMVVGHSSGVKCLVLFQTAKIFTTISHSSKLAGQISSSCSLHLLCCLQNWEPDSIQIAFWDLGSCSLAYKSNLLY